MTRNRGIRPYFGLKRNSQPPSSSFRLFYGFYEWEFRIQIPFIVTATRSVIDSHFFVIDNWQININKTSWMLKEHLSKLALKALLVKPFYDDIYLLIWLQKLAGGDENVQHFSMTQRNSADISLSCVTNQSNLVVAPFLFADKYWLSCRHSRKKQITFWSLCNEI